MVLCQNLAPTSLFVLDLQENYFTDPLPAEVGELKNLNYFLVSGNKLSDEIPYTLGDCTSLVYLDLSHNHLKGQISRSLMALKVLEGINISRNNISGQIPSYFENYVHLRILDLSFNHFEGEAPITGIFQNSSKVSLIGNKQLCGGVREPDLPPCTFGGTKKHGDIVHIIVIVIVASAVACSVLLLSCSVAIRGTRKLKIGATSTFSLEDVHLKATYSMIHKATNNFCSDSLIGVGSYDSVYKAVLDTNGAVLAVKVMNLVQSGAVKSFLAECEALRAVHHRNLVKILSTCSGVNFRGNDFKALIYEFMPNGSLEKWLYLRARGDDLPLCLSLIQRLEIAIDIALALNYLHHECDPPIVHCDINPSNVFLDGDMVAHLGDFGLARTIIGEATITLELRGSIGYIPPEYATGGDVSTRGDVYSYGILLLEMLQGRGLWMTCSLMNSTFQSM